MMVGSCFVEVQGQLALLGPIGLVQAGQPRKAMPVIFPET
jgi:hypothetical protein